MPMTVRIQAITKARKAISSENGEMLCNAKLAKYSPFARSKLNAAAAFDLTLIALVCMAIV